MEAVVGEPADLVGHSDGAFVAMLVSMDENPELLWALRGGGGNFGVATHLEFRLHPLQSVIGGKLTYRGLVGDVLRAFRDIVADSPRDASCQAVLVLDESLEPTVVVFPCVTGSENNHPLLGSLRATRGSWRTGTPAFVHRAAVPVRHRLRSRPALLEGPFRAGAARRADRRARPPNIGARTSARRHLVGVAPWRAEKR